MTLVHTRTHDDQPLPCVTCGRAVPDPGAGLLVACPACTRRLRAALRRGAEVKPTGGRSRINRSRSNDSGRPDGRVGCEQGAGDGL